MAGIYTPTNPGWGNAATVAKKKKKLPPKPKPIKLSPLDALRKQLLGQIRTPEQLEADAQRLAGTQLTSSQDLIRTESQRLRDDADRRRQAITNAMLAAAGENAAMAPQILAGYQSASQGLGQLGSLVTGSVGDAVRGDIASQSEALARVGQAGPGGDPSQQQGVEQYVGGYLPASSLAALGANANAGYLGQVAASRMGAVEVPAKAYEETLASLSDQELSQLSEIEQSRPDLVGKILDNLMQNQSTISKSIVSIETEKRQIAAARAKIADAQAELNYKYAQLRSQALTKQQKILADSWAKTQQRKIDRQKVLIDQFQANTGRMAAETSRARLDWETEHPGQSLGGSGAKQKTVADLVASAGKSRSDRDAGMAPEKIANSQFEALKRQVPQAQWPALKAALLAWAQALPLRQKSSDGGFLGP